MEIKMSLTNSGTVDSFLFCESLQECLQSYSLKNNKNLKIFWTSYNHHCEIHDIAIYKNGEYTSYIELFNEFYLIVTSDKNQIKIFISAKDKSILGNYSVEGHLKKFKRFLKSNLTYTQSNCNEIVFFD